MIGTLVGMLARALVVFAATTFAVVPETMAQARKIALVVGNSAYAHAPVLANPANDARLMGQTLAAAGFDVKTVIDADQRTMKTALVSFGRELRASNAVGLFYYAGHGIQVNGYNYLVPVDANILDETEVAIDTVSLGEFLSTLERAQGRINIVVLDACRNNPFARSFRSGSQGLARVEAPTGTFVAYATAPGSVAADGDDVNSPYTSALARAMARPGLTIERVFKEVRRSVMEETSGAQVPWESSSITGEFYFKSGDGTAAAPVARPAQVDERQLDLAYWDSVKDSSEPSLFRSYLNQFPRGVFAPIARARIDALTVPEPPRAAAPGAAVPAAPSGPASRRAIIAHSSRRQIGERELARLDCDELWMARNEIFARNGYCFSTPRGQEVFGNQGCTTTSQDILSALELENMRTIRAVESLRCAGESRSGSASVAAAPQPAALWHYGTGLNPAGDNFLALKAAPDIRARRLAKMGPDTPLLVIGQSGPWRKVRLRDGREGWAHSRYIGCCR